MISLLRAPACTAASAALSPASATWTKTDTWYADDVLVTSTAARFSRR
ncbi:MAG: hypothetical protein R2715_08195 [Ilumatobacteraceae bacterium]